MSLDQATVKKIATLARLDVQDNELDHLAGELSNILTFVAHLSEVNTDGIEPMTSVAELTAPQRADIVTDGDIQAKILANAPEQYDGFFLVPKVVE